MTAGEKETPEDAARRFAKRVLELEEEVRLHEEFLVSCTELVPEGYDGDDSAEAIVLRYLKDMDKLGGIIARLTSAYR